MRAGFKGLAGVPEIVIREDSLLGDAALREKCARPICGPAVRDRDSDAVA